MTHRNDVIRYAIRAVLLCGHVCASLLTAEETAAAAEEASKEAVKAKAGGPAGVLSKATIVAEIAQEGGGDGNKVKSTTGADKEKKPLRGIPLPYLPPELWHTVFDLLQAADFPHWCHPAESKGIL